MRVAARRRRSRRLCRVARWRAVDGLLWRALRVAPRVRWPALRAGARGESGTCGARVKRAQSRGGGRVVVCGEGVRPGTSGGHEWRRARGWILGAASGREGSAVGGGRVLSDGRLDCSPVVCPSPTRPPSTDVSHSRVGARGGEGGAVRAGVFIRSEGMPRAASLLGLGPPSS